MTSPAKASDRMRRVAETLSPRRNSVAMRRSANDRFATSIRSSSQGGIGVNSTSRISTSPTTSARSLCAPNTLRSAPIMSSCPDLHPRGRGLFFLVKRGVDARHGLEQRLADRLVDLDLREQAPRERPVFHDRQPQARGARAQLERELARALRDHARRTHPAAVVGEGDGEVRRVGDEDVGLRQALHGLGALRRLALQLADARPHVRIAFAALQLFLNLAPAKARSLTSVLPASTRVLSENTRLNPVAGLMRLKSGLSGKALNTGPVCTRLATSAASTATARKGANIESVAVVSWPSQAAASGPLNETTAARSSAPAARRTPAA